jgi:predicted acetylornithine/succinylornithine family transaminase
MTTEEIMSLTDAYVMKTYGRLPMAFVKGQGALLWDAEGTEYLDFLAGIAVCGTGHCHPKVAEAIARQAATLIHTSNLYHIEPQGLLAKRLCEISFADKAFFCNSGAEANEAAIKLARKWSLLKRGPGRCGIVAAAHSFHGRTLATVTATGQAKYNANFAPLPAGFSHVPFDDIDALAAACDDNICAVMLEPIQAEGGVNVPAPGYFAKVRELCDARGMLLIVDEVQTGMGRTGKWFGYEHEGIEPDIMSLAKCLGGGFPIGACLATDTVAAAFEPGDHASTFGGNFLACAAGLAAIEAIETEGMLDNCARMGAYLRSRIEELAQGVAAFDHVRGRGLLMAIVFKGIEPKAVQQRCFDAGLIVNAMGTDRLRITPPLLVTEEQCNRAAETIVAAIRAG